MHLINRVPDVSFLTKPNDKECITTATIIAIAMTMTMTINHNHNHK